MPRFLASPRLWWTAVVLWFGMLFFLSSLPKLPPGPGFRYEDKVYHTLYYAIGGGAFFLARRLARAPASAGRAFLSALVFCMAVGWFDEWHQTFTPGRRGNDLFDWLADALGGILGPLAAWPIGLHLLRLPSGK